MNGKNIGNKIKREIPWNIALLIILLFLFCSREPARKISKSNNGKLDEIVEVPINSKSDIYKLISQDEIDFSHIIKKADSLFEAEQYKEAESLYIKAHKLSLKSNKKTLIGFTLIGIGAAKGRQKEHKKAIEIFNEALEYKNSMNSIALSRLYFNSGVSYHKLNKIEKATENYTKAIKLNSKFAEAYYNRGHIYSKIEYGKAIEDYTKAIEFLPKEAELYNYRGDSYLRKGNYDRAIKDYSKAIKLKPKEYKFVYNRGLAYYDNSNYQEAINDFTKAIKINPKDPYVYYWRGNSFVGKKMYDKAISDFTKAIKINPKDPDFYYYRGISYIRKTMYDKAISDLTKVIELDSVRYEAYGNRAIIYREIEEFDKAISGFNKIIELNPDDPKAYFDRGITFARKGELKKATKDLDKAIKLKPDFTEAERKLEEINQLIKDLNKEKTKQK
jgi:tetratricopeptide (TPR) repeat protein